MRTFLSEDTVQNTTKSNVEEKFDEYFNDASILGYHGACKLNGDERKAGSIGQVNFITCTKPEGSPIEYVMKSNFLFSMNSNFKRFRIFKSNFATRVQKNEGVSHIVQEGC